MTDPTTPPELNEAHRRKAELARKHLVDVPMSDEEKNLPDPDYESPSTPPRPHIEPLDCDKLIEREGWDCAKCGHRHAGRTLGYICVGCPCAETATPPRSNELIRRTMPDGEVLETDRATWRLYDELVSPLSPSTRGSRAVLKELSRRQQEIETLRHEVRISAIRQSSDSRIAELEQEIDRLRQALTVIHVSTRGDEKEEQRTIRQWLDDHGIFNGDMSGSRRLVAEVCKAALPAPPKEDA